MKIEGERPTIRTRKAIPPHPTFFTLDPSINEMAPRTRSQDKVAAPDSDPVDKKFLKGVSQINNYDGDAWDPWLHCMMTPTFHHVALVW